MSEDASKDQQSIKDNTTKSDDTPKEGKESQETIIKWVDQLKDESTREAALTELSRKRETFSDLAIYIWYSTGTVSAL
ncbi:MAG: Rcd1-like cell differentiation family protein [archaeon]|nr:Rcd1-like cell differentiation family protein [archaeon]